MFNYNKRLHNFEDIVRLIENKNNYRRIACGNSYKLLCPSHNDRKPSLSASKGKDDITLLKCFTGCRIEDICNSIGIQVRDLFPSNSKRSSYE